MLTDAKSAELYASHLAHATASSMVSELPPFPFSGDMLACILRGTDLDVTARIDQLFEEPQ